MENHGYAPAAIEPHWQAVWREREAFKIPNDIHILKQKPKFYVLGMFPYASGAGLHMGHPKNYVPTDVLANFRRMQGYHVMHPMGWDAFGLPTERTAVREDIHPAIITRRNTDTFRQQIQRLGFSYDWTREIDTSAPDYYKWTQWMFLRLYEKGLAYLADVPVNWCPALGTVLSNEEVKDGKYVDTGDPVERRLMRQWMLKITAYAERLLADLGELDWPDGLKEMQRHWIGKSEGAEVQFQVMDSDSTFTVFTTRPDTLFGATYCVLAPEHPLVTEITSSEQETAVTDYVKEAVNKSDLQRTDLATEKTGVFTGAYAINPANNEPIPIWVADYVLITYGTGAIMAVPGHDERDHEFATAFGLPIVEVIQPLEEETSPVGAVSNRAASAEETPSGASIKNVVIDNVNDGFTEKDVIARETLSNASRTTKKPFVGDGVCVNSGFLNGLRVADAKETMIAWLESEKKGTRQVQYRLRDWLFSRQRYWGEPFPLAHVANDEENGGENGSIVPLPDEALPIELPSVDAYKPTADGEPPLARASDEWLNITLPDGRKARRETNIMPQWAGSCWYYLRYLDAHNAEAPWDSELERYWMPVDLYMGGTEHAVLHLLYARFWHKVLYDCGLVSTKEPFQGLVNQGTILAESYQDAAGKYYEPHDVAEKDGAFVAKSTGTPLIAQMEKMSKSKLNGINPNDVIDTYGADSIRLYLLFIGPVTASTPWQTAGVEGVHRFLQRVWRLVVNEENGELSKRLTDAPGDSNPQLWKELHQTIKQVTEDTESIDKMNTAVSAMMIFVNNATQAETIPKATLKVFLRLLAPYAPHIAQELWHRLGETELIAYETWPVHDEQVLAEATVTIVAQVNGKLRNRLELPADATDEAIEEAALADERIQRFVAGKPIRKVIVVPNRLINIVV